MSHFLLRSEQGIVKNLLMKYYIKTRPISSDGQSPKS